MMEKENGNQINKVLTWTHKILKFLWDLEGLKWKEKKKGKQEEVIWAYEGN